MEPKLVIAGIDVHKKMLAVVVVDEDHPQQALEQRKFGTNIGELKHLAAWLSPPADIRNPRHHADPVAFHQLTDLLRGPSPFHAVISAAFVPLFNRGSSDAYA